MEGKKRERNSNFSHGDTEILVNLVQKYKNIIENKKSDAATWQEKERAWKALEAEYNCSGAEIYRDAKHLKIKYEALKRDTRKKFRKSGGADDAPRLTPAQQKVKQLILSSVEGGESTCDFDQPEPDIGGTDTQRESIDIPEWMGSADNSVMSMPDSDTADDSETKNILEENPPPKMPMDYAENPGPSTSWVDVEVVETPPKQWAEWKHSNLKSEHPDTCKPETKKPVNRLAEEKLKLVRLQKSLIEEELKEKKMKKHMLMMEMRHKKELHELEKEERLLKISILKSELENNEWY